MDFKLAFLTILLFKVIRWRKHKKLSKINK